MVRFEAPPGLTHVYTMEGHSLVVHDGHVTVSEQNVQGLIGAGFVRTWCRFRNAAERAAITSKPIQTVKLDDVDTRASPTDVVTIIADHPISDRAVPLEVKKTQETMLHTAAA